jgi:hypothetical protein
VKPTTMMMMPPIACGRYASRFSVQRSNSVPPKIRNALAAKTRSTIQNTTVEIARLVARAKASDRPAERGAKRANSQSMLSSARRTRPRTRCAISQPMMRTATAIRTLGR